jgi:hypothetical protein
MSPAVLALKIEIISTALARIEANMLTRKDLELLESQLEQRFVAQATFDRVVAELRDELNGKSLAEQVRTIAAWVAIVGAGGGALFGAFRAAGGHFGP